MSEDLEITRLEETAKAITEDLVKVGVVEEGVIEKVAEDVKPEISPDEEAAREKGWKPAEEFADGEDKEFVSAKEYLDRGKFYKTISKQSKEIKDLRKVINQFSDHMKKAEEVAFEKAIKKIETSKRVAVEEGDVHKYEALETEFQNLSKDVMEKQQNQIEEQQSETLVDAVEEFKGRNKWFNPTSVDSTVMAMTAYAQAVAAKISAEQPNLSPDDALRKVESDVKKMYPSNFENTKQGEPAQVLPRSAGKSAAARGKLRLSDLPEEFRQVGKNIVRMIPGYTEERYIKELQENGSIPKT